jgi:hypothetical protein
MAVSEVNTGWQHQLHIRCEQAVEMDPDKSVSERRHAYDTEEYYRTLVISGNASVFDLIKAMLCAFGINSAEYDHRNGFGSLGLEDIYLQDVLATQDGTKSVAAVGPIPGLSRKALKHPEDKTMLRSTVIASELKKVKVAQLLDKPWFDTPTRSSHAGRRSRVWMLVKTPERCQFISRARGGCAVSVKPHLYSFAVLCEAIATKKDQLSSFQRYLPRCVEGNGMVVGGNDIAWEWGDETDGLDCMELDDLNVTFGGERKVSGADDDAADDFSDIVHWLRTPLFVLEDTDDGSGNLIPSDREGETRRQRAVRPRRADVPGEGCVLQ